MDIVRAILREPMGFASLVVLYFAITAAALYRREIRTGWSRLTDRVMDLLDRWWVLRYLPKEQGGEGRLTRELRQGERVEFCLPRHRAMMLLTTTPFPDPRVKEPKKPPPLLVWLLTLPLGAVSVAALAYNVKYLFTFDFDSYTTILPMWLAVVSLCVGLVLSAPSYWVYEWMRLHEYWVMTTYIGIMVVMRPFGRMTIRIGPVKWMGESVVFSLWANKPIPICWIGGVISNIWDFGTILIGSIAYGPFFDFLDGWPHYTTFQEILQSILGKAEENQEVKKAFEAAVLKLETDGIASEAVVGVMGGDRPYAQAQQKIRALEQALANRLPGASVEINLADWRALLGSTHWDLWDGTELPAPIKVPV